jgi:UDP:flavonoid glycosyltransferase YjiC (YdhE family)
VSSILTIGPLLDGLGEGDTTFRERFQGKPQSGDSLKWLNNQANSSVLYVCFGSVARLSVTQIRELAVGLERSGQHFFWVLRSPDPKGLVSSEILPEGFLERTKSRGIVYMEWAPQLQILAHPAIGGFLTHCGWNSALESMCMGVPMVAMPMQAEQMMNATLIAKNLGIGLRINEKGGWVETVGREPIEKAVRTLMDDTTGEKVRRKAKQVSDTLGRTMQPGGSSHRNLALFVQQLKSLKANLLVK